MSHRLWRGGVTGETWRRRVARKLPSSGQQTHITAWSPRVPSNDDPEAHPPGYYHHGNRFPSSHAQTVTSLGNATHQSRGSDDRGVKLIRASFSSPHSPVINQKSADSDSGFSNLRPRQQTHNIRYSNKRHDTNSQRIPAVGAHDNAHNPDDVDDSSHKRDQKRASPSTPSSSSPSSLSSASPTAFLLTPPYPVSHQPNTTVASTPLQTLSTPPTTPTTLITPSAAGIVLTPPSSLRDPPYSSTPRFFHGISNNTDPLKTHPSTPHNHHQDAALSSPCTSSHYRYPYLACAAPSVVRMDPLSCEYPPDDMVLLWQDGGGPHDHNGDQKNTCSNSNSRGPHSNSRNASLDSLSMEEVLEGLKKAAARHMRSRVHALTSDLQHDSNHDLHPHLECKDAPYRDSLSSPVSNPESLSCSGHKYVANPRPDLVHDRILTQDSIPDCDPIPQISPGPHPEMRNVDSFAEDFDHQRSSDRWIDEAYVGAVHANPNQDSSRVDDVVALTDEIEPGTISYLDINRYGSLTATGDSDPHPFSSSTEACSNNADLNVDKHIAVLHAPLSNSDSQASHNDPVGDRRFFRLGQNSQTTHTTGEMSSRACDDHDSVVFAEPTHCEENDLSPSVDINNDSVLDGQGLLSYSSMCDDSKLEFMNSTENSAVTLNKGLVSDSNSGHNDNRPRGSFVSTNGFLCHEDISFSRTNEGLIADNSSCKISSNKSPNRNSQLCISVNDSQALTDSGCVPDEDQVFVFEETNLDLDTQQQEVFNDFLTIPHDLEHTNVGQHINDPEQINTFNLGQEHNTSTNPQTNEKQDQISDDCVHNDLVYKHFVKERVSESFDSKRANNQAYSHMNANNQTSEHILIPKENVQSGINFLCDNSRITKEQIPNQEISRIDSGIEGSSLRYYSDVFEDEDVDTVVPNNLLHTTSTPTVRHNTEEFNDVFEDTTVNNSNNINSIPTPRPRHNKRHRYFDDTAVDVQRTTVTCWNPDCGKTRTLDVARGSFKNCHNCPMACYCSRHCRSTDWARHKATLCHGSRVNSACRRVIRMCHESPAIHDALTNLARRGYFAKGRGCVMLGFPDLTSAEEFVSCGLRALSLTPIYVCLSELSVREMRAGDCRRLKRLCQEYDPGCRFVLNVGVGSRWNRTFTSPRSPREEDNNHDLDLGYCWTVEAGQACVSPARRSSGASNNDHHTNRTRSRSRPSSVGSYHGRDRSDSAGSDAGYDSVSESLSQFDVTSSSSVPSQSSRVTYHDYSGCLLRHRMPIIQSCDHLPLSKFTIHPSKNDLHPSPPYPPHPTTSDVSENYFHSGNNVSTHQQHRRLNTTADSEDSGTSEDLLDTSRYDNLDTTNDDNHHDSRIIHNLTDHHPCRCRYGSTLLLTGVAGRHDDQRQRRELCFIHVTRRLRQRGVNLRRQFPRIYAELVLYVTSGCRFPSRVIFPVDSHKRQMFTCVLMPEAEAAPEWAESATLLEQLELSRAAVARGLSGYTWSERAETWRRRKRRMRPVTRKEMFLQELHYWSHLGPHFRRVSLERGVNCYHDLDAGYCGRVRDADGVGVSLLSPYPAKLDSSAVINKPKSDEDQTFDHADRVTPSRPTSCISNNDCFSQAEVKHDSSLVFNINSPLWSTFSQSNPIASSPLMEEISLGCRKNPEDSTDCIPEPFDCPLCTCFICHAHDIGEFSYADFDLQSFSYFTAQPPSTDCNPDPHQSQTLSSKPQTNKDHRDYPPKDVSGFKKSSISNRNKSIKSKAKHQHGSTPYRVKFSLPSSYADDACKDSAPLSTNVDKVKSILSTWKTKNIKQETKQTLPNDYRDPNSRHVNKPSCTDLPDALVESHTDSTNQAFIASDW